MRNIGLNGTAGLKEQFGFSSLQFQANQLNIKALIMQFNFTLLSLVLQCWSRWAKCCCVCVQIQVIFYCKEKRCNISNNAGLHGGLNLQDMVRLVYLPCFVLAVPVVKLCLHHCD